MGHEIDCRMKSQIEGLKRNFMSICEQRTGQCAEVDSMSAFNVNAQIIGQFTTEQTDGCACVNARDAIYR